MLKRLKIKELFEGEVVPKYINEKTIIHTEGIMEIVKHQYGLRIYYLKEKRT